MATSFPPGVLSQLDQDMAEAGRKVDVLVGHFREIAAESGEIQAIADVSLALLLGEAAGMLGTVDILLAAIARLARQEDGS